MRADRLLRLAIIASTMIASTFAYGSDKAQQALAAAFIAEAATRCGHEISSSGREMLAGREPGHDTQTRFVEQLWRRTWQCDPDFIGTSCMAARLALCERVFVEYGPQGVVVPGLLKPIIHK